MNFGALGHWEWLVIEGVVLALLVFEMLRSRRAVRRDRAAAESKTKPPA